MSLNAIKCTSLAVIRTLAHAFTGERAHAAFPAVDRNVGRPLAIEAEIGIPEAT